MASELRMAKLWQELTAQHIPIRWIILMQEWPLLPWCCLGALKALASPATDSP